MKDLTQGPIGRQLAGLAVPVAAGMLLQTLYYLVDLYFVARLGDAAIAGVSAAGNVMFVIFALTQMLSVGTVTLISHAVGRKDRADANHIFNQSVALAGVCTLATLLGGYAFTPAYMRFLGADAATAAALDESRPRSSLVSRAASLSSWSRSWSLETRSSSSTALRRARSSWRAAQSDA